MLSFAHEILAQRVLFGRRIESGDLVRSPDNARLLVDALRHRAPAGSSVVDKH